MSRKQSPKPKRRVSEQPANPTSKESNGATTPTQQPSDAGRQHLRNQRIAQEAEVIGKQFFPALMSVALKVPHVELRESYKEFLTQFLEDAGNPTDPVEKMQLEQLALVHFRIGALHGMAAGTNSTEGTRILNGCAARLMGEFRKLSVAVRSARNALPQARRDTGRLKIAAAG